MTDKWIEGMYYECELIRMGRDENGFDTSDEDNWFAGQTYWNIWVNLRDEDGDHMGEVLDLDIPVELDELAGSVYDIVCQRVDDCNQHKLLFT